MGSFRHTEILPIMSLNLCRRNLEDQFFFFFCQGRLHALLPPGFAVEKNWGSWSKRRSSLSPMVDVGDWTHFLFVFFLFLSPSATVEASKPPSGNSAAFRRWSSSRRRIFPRVCSISSLVPEDSSDSGWLSALFKRSSTLWYSSSMWVTSSEGLKVGQKWISVS